MDRTGDGVLQYAQKFVSETGKKDGLYWPVKEEEEPSPLGLLAAEASVEGYGRKPRGDQPPVPYHGYFYRILKQQGKNASGGTRDYVVRGKMIGGFALVAYPAEYGNSGIMSFYREPGWGGLPEGSGQEDSTNRQYHEVF